MKKILSLAMGVVLSATVILGSSEYTFAAEKSPKIETNVSDLTEGKLKTVIAILKMFCQKTQRYLQLHHQKQKYYQKIMQLLLDRQE